MANNYVVKDANGTSVTFVSTDIGAAVQLQNVRVADATAANFLPTMDAVARAGFQKVTDGTNTAAVKAASTQALATDPAFVVRPMMPTDGTNVQPSMDAVARPGFFKLTDGTNTMPSGDAVARPVYVAPMTNGGQTAVTASSATAAAANNQTLPGAVGKTTFISGFQITGAGATAGSTIAVTVTGTITGTLNYRLIIPAGATVGITALLVQFGVPIPASAANTAIVVNVPSFGAGNLDAAVVAHGFQQ